MDQATETVPRGWPDAWVLALGDASLRDASSPAIFQRGKSYAASESVEVVAEDPLPKPALRAEVTGTELYTTEVWIEDDALAGSCDCPNAQDGWFCKHQVAVALVWRERLGRAPSSDAETVSPGAAPTAQRPRPAKDRRLALRDFLCGLEPVVLADKLLDFADRDRDISRELQQWRKLSEATGELVDLKPLVNEVLSSERGFIAWDEAGSYARRAEAVVPLLRRACERDPAAAVVLCVHALRRAWGVLAQADDSDGEIGGVCEAIGTELTQAVRSAGPLPASFGDTYLQLQFDEPFGCFDTTAVEASMGEAALARYRQVLAERWRTAKDAVLAMRAENAAKVAMRKGRARVYEKFNERELRLSTLERLHLVQLKQMGANEEVLAILREDLSEAYGHSQVVAFLEATGRLNEAFEQAKRGYDAFPGERRLQEDLLRCYEREGMTQEALMLRRSQFEHRPSAEGYHHVLNAGRSAGEDTNALREALFDFMHRQERAARQGQAAQDVSLRAEVLGSEGRWVEACRLVQPPSDCRDAVLNRIAIHLPAEQHKQAVELLLRIFEEVIQRSSSPYRDALALVNEIGQRMDTVRRAAWLNQLRTQYKVKRNFVRDLPKR